MNNQSNRVKAFFFRFLKVAGKKASDIATNAQLKLNEINLEARRNEIMSELPNRAIELWKNGASLPVELTELLQELTTVDQKLMLLKAQKYANIDNEQEGETVSEPEETETAQVQDNLQEAVITTDEEIPEVGEKSEN